MARDYVQELANIHNALAESVLTMDDDELLREVFEEWWEEKGWDGDNPSAIVTPADDYSKFEFGLICFKAGVEMTDELRQKFKGIIEKAKADAGRAKRRG